MSLVMGMTIVAVVHWSRWRVRRFERFRCRGRADRLGSRRGRSRLWMIVMAICRFDVGTVVIGCGAGWFGMAVL